MIQISANKWYKIKKSFKLLKAEHVNLSREIDIVSWAKVKHEKNWGN